MKRLAVDLLKTFWEARNQPLSGYSIMKMSGWSSGAMYPALMALEKTEMLSSRWVEGPYPRQRVYEMTETGKTMAQALIDKEQSQKQKQAG